MSDSIKVAIKVRPLIKREKDDNSSIQWTVQGNSIVSTDPEMKKRGDGGFYFDHIFDMKASNLDVFDTIVKPIVNAGVNGFNGTVFAYGQTSSGKTYTMMGSPNELGIIPLAIDYMFDAITNTVGREFLLRVSYLEIYNERVNDLLNKSATDLKLKEDGSGQVVVQCKEEITNCPDSVLSIMKKGDKNRRIGETNMNERSSRGHTIFRITIESRETGADSNGAIQVSQLNLVDLAGSERARQTGATGERFKEGRHINMSLTTLGLVIMQLSESQDGQKHVNFRDSKLTRLLQTSLGGNAMTAIICAVTPAALEETQCTLSFASRAKSVKNKPQINEVMSDAALLKRYAKQLSKLQEELERIKNENRVAEVEEMESKLQEKDRINQLLEERIELLKTRIVSGDTIAHEESFRCKSKRRQTWGGPGMFSKPLHAFQPKGVLPTIKEVSFEKPHRKSIIQSMDIMNQTFQTAFTDFELELFESERDRDSRDNISDSEEEPFVAKCKNRVTFRDDVTTIRSKNGSFDTTPEKCNTATQTAGDHVSPSTPKHVLRRCIMDLTREFVELREYTTLEKQVICQSNRCCTHEEEEPTDLNEIIQQKYSPQCSEIQYGPEVKERLTNLNIIEENDISRVITELCLKLNDVEKQNALEQEKNCKTMKQFLELEKQFENITSERNEFEYISCQLRAELKKKIGELELQNMCEENIKQEKQQKIIVLEKQIENITLEKNNFDRINSELRAELTKKVSELQKQTECIISERNEFEHIRQKLCMELNIKSSEVEKLKNNSHSKLINEKVQELENEIENIMSDKRVVEQLNADLRTELEQMSSELKLKIASEQVEKQKVSELEKRLEQIILEKQDHIHINIELDRKIEDLELKIISEKAISEEATERILELEKQITDITLDKENVICDLEKQIACMTQNKYALGHINNELHTKLDITVTEGPQTKTTLDEMVQKITDLQNKVTNIALERDELECIKNELCTELNKKRSEFESEITNVTSKKNDLERLNNELRRQLDQKTSEFDNEIINVRFEKSELEHTINELRSELDKKVSGFENENVKVRSEKSELQHTMNDLRMELDKKASEFDSQIISVTFEKNELERVICELRSELDKKVSEFENEIVKVRSEKSELEHTMNELRTELDKKASEFESQIMSVTFEKNELEHLMYELRSELDKKVSKLENEIVKVRSEKSELEHTMNELCMELDKKASEFDSQIISVTFEKNELEHIIHELRSKLNKKTTELETHNIIGIALERNELEHVTSKFSTESDKAFSEQNAKIMPEENEDQLIVKKMSELITPVDIVTSERNSFECINDELPTELHNRVSKLCSQKESTVIDKESKTENIIEFKNEVESVIVEKFKLEKFNYEVSVHLNEEQAELEKKPIGQNEWQKAVEKISKLETQIANMISEKDELERINEELHKKLNMKTSALKAKIASEKIQNEGVLELISELEMEIGHISSTKDEFKCIITELRSELDLRTSELESEQIKNQDAMKKIDELTKNIEIVTSERKQFEFINNRLNVELNEKNFELETKIMPEQTENLNIRKKMSGLEKQIEHIFQKNGVKYIDDFDNRASTENSESKSKCEADYVTENNNLRNCILDLQDFMTNFRAESQDLKDQLEDQSLLSCSRFNESIANDSYRILNIEAEKSVLKENLQLKSQELEDIKCDVRSLKTDIKKLEETIYLITTENVDLAAKLTTEQENSKRTELNLQQSIDKLYAQIYEVTNEKITFESDLAILKEHLESMRSQRSANYDSEELFSLHQQKIDKLTAENIELTTLIAERNKELENIKESKSLLYDHECIYKEKVAVLKDRNEYLLSENNELSTDLIDKIEENDLLREQCDILKSKVEKSLTMKANITEDNLEHLKTENSILKAEIVELKTKVKLLSEENAKFSDNLLDTMENLNSSRIQKSNDNTLLVPTLFNCSTEYDEFKQDMSQSETRESLMNTVTILQNKIDHLTVLNKKLSDLKLTSCTQCAHLRNLNESRRALKLEAKILNRKLEDLQRKLDRKHEDTELLKNKINEELNTSEHDLSMNVSFVNEMNVSFIENKIQNLNAELQNLRSDHDKLSTLYEDKCNELEQLQSVTTSDTVKFNDDSTPKHNLNKFGCRIQYIQNDIDQLKHGVDEIKKNSMNFTTMIDEYKNEKTNLLAEINRLHYTNEELQQKLLNNEGTAISKVQILENELANMSTQIEELFTREKELEGQKLMLEVELDGIKAEEQNNHSLINQLNTHISFLKNELDLVTNQKNELINSQTTECKKDELEYLRKQCKELEKENAQRKESEQCSILSMKEMESYINELQKNIMNQENYCKEIQGKGARIETLLHEQEQEKCMLTQKLQASEIEMDEYKNNLEIKYKNEFDSMLQQYQQYIKELENNVQKLNDNLSKYIHENVSLMQELNNLRSVKEHSNETMTENDPASDDYRMLIDANEKLNEELNDIRKCLIKELKSLRRSTSCAEYTSKSVIEIFTVLLQTLVSKEEEIIKTVRETYEKERQKLEDEKQQCIDTEKRAIVWSKELEAETEKLQSDLTDRERTLTKYQSQISQLEHLLRESIHEKDMFKEKMETLEMDFNNLQAEFDKQCKVDTNQEKAIFVAKKREKEAQETFRSKEMELQSRLKNEQEIYEKKINEFIRTIESYKTKNLELNNTIEGLDANERHLKNIIEANSTEIKRKNQNIERMSAELEQLTQIYNEASLEMEQKNSHITEITTILKSKCDTLSEYKSKLELILPEYEALKIHVKEQKLAIEKCREEIEILRKEREEQLAIINDKLNSEKIKNVSLNKQLQELSNKNIILIEDLNGLRERCEELEQANAKLANKIRNSTSKVKADAEIEELKELNKRLQNNLEGACNRVSDLQEIKNQSLKEFADLKVKYELVLQENIELKTTLASYKSKRLSSSSYIDEDKYDALLLEKNKIALELEGKKIILIQKDKELNECVSQIQQLTGKNKELDEELEEYAAIIRERDTEISRLEDQLHSRLTENVVITEIELKLKNLNEENEKLRDQVEAFKMRLQMDVERDVKFQNDKIIHSLKKENLELQTRIREYQHHIENTVVSDGNVLKEIDMNQMKNSDKKTQNNSDSLPNRVKALEAENHRIIKELDAKQLLLNEKDIELLQYISKMEDITAKNKGLQNLLEEYAEIIRNRDLEISKLQNNLGFHPIEDNLLDDIKRKLEFFTKENNKLRNEIIELQMRSRTDMHKRILKESTNEQQKNLMCNQEYKQYEEKCEQLKKKIHELELQLVSKNGKIATLEIQIQSENFPYKKKCKELEELVLAFRKKNAELLSEVRKLQRTVNDVNAWECDICRRWRINRQDQACQTIPNNAVRLCSTSTGVVEDHVKIQKLEKEKTLMKDLCRARSRQIKDLADRVKELEEAQSSLTSQSKHSRN